MSGSGEASGSINNLTTAYWVLVILKVIAVAQYLVGVQRMRERGDADRIADRLGLCVQDMMAGVDPGQWKHGRPGS